MKNEIIKVLYKEKPTALFKEKINDNNIYITTTSIGEVLFTIPDHEMINEDGKKIIAEVVEAQLLIRWISSF